MGVVSKLSNYLSLDVHKTKIDNTAPTLVLLDEKRQFIFNFVVCYAFNATSFENFFNEDFLELTPINAENSRLTNLRYQFISSALSFRYDKDFKQG